MFCVNPFIEVFLVWFNVSDLGMLLAAAYFALVHVSDFSCRNKAIPAKLLKQGYRCHKLRKAFLKFYRRYSEMVENINWLKKFPIDEILFISMVTIEVKCSDFHFCKTEYPFVHATVQFDLTSLNEAWYKNTLNTTGSFIVFAEQNL